MIGQRLLVFVGLLAVTIAQWSSSVKSKWDDGSFSSSTGSWSGSNRHGQWSGVGVPMMGAVPGGHWSNPSVAMGYSSFWPTSNVQMAFVPFQQMGHMGGLSQQSSFHKWDDGSSRTQAFGTAAAHTSATSAKSGGGD